MVMQTGLNRVLVALAKDHQPLIFSPKRMRWFSSVMEDNKRIVNSLMGIYQNTTGVEIKDSMNQSFQRMQAQFPSVPQGNRHLLLATAFEAQTYKVVMAGGLPTLGGQPRRGRSRTAAMTAVASAGRDDAPLHKSTTGAVINVGDEALTSVALPFVSNDSDGAREPPPQQQQQQQQQLLLQRQWRRQLFGGTNEKQVEELGLQSTYEIYQSTIPDGPQLVEREPAAKHFVSSWSSNIHSSPSSSSSSSSNDNTNNINKYSIDALVPDNSSRFITPITTTPTATTTTTTETTAAAAAAATPIAGGNAQKFGVEFNQNADLDMDMSSFDDFDFDRDDFYEMDENGGCI
ncbi:MAG: hypothetical protein J3R72DRAFT_249206 [Linnemannia gamsii]|nr:MAG: hypothetical protein J3R72DRAFT_249206 [Linnemannia gamsii]